MAHHDARGVDECDGQSFGKLCCFDMILEGHVCKASIDYLRLGLHLVLSKALEEVS